MMITVQGFMLSKRTAIYHKLHTKINPLPLIVLQTILLGARKWKGPRLGLVLVRFLRKSRYFTIKKQS